MGGQAGPEGGDTIGFAFAGADDRQFESDTPGSGTWTFSNRKPLSYSNVEGTAIDDVAPVFLGLTFETEPQHALKARFSEDVSNYMSMLAFFLTNLDTDVQMSWYHSQINYEYDFDTNTAILTFPGFEDGKLPPGNYRATIPWNTDDFFGNHLPQNYTLDFTVAGAPAIPGDANGDDRVDIFDLGVLATNWQRTDATGPAEGDFSGDGKVDIFDLGILATNWQAGTSSARDGKPSSGAPAMPFADAVKKVFGSSARTRSLLAELEDEQEIREHDQAELTLDAALPLNGDEVLFGKTSRSIGSILGGV
jgi:hypothetical protein